MHPCTSLALAIGFAAAAANAQQLPDILLPNIDPDVSGTILRLTDRNSDGVYDANPVTTNEVYDWFRYEPFNIDSSHRDVIAVPGVPGSYYAIDFAPGAAGADNRIALLRDANNDGWVSVYEMFPVLTSTWLAESAAETEEMAYDGVGFMWVNNGGSGEGMFFSRDLNGDLDFMDTVNGVDETICVIAESTNRTSRAGEPAGGEIGSNSWTVARTTAASTFTPSEMKSVTCDRQLSLGSLAGQDPVANPDGLFPCKYIFDDDDEDLLLALEDLDGDGDFINDADPNPANWDVDTGELYVWLNLNPSGAADAHPAAGITLPVCDELEDVEVDDTGLQNVYYILNATPWDPGAPEPGACHIFRAIDNNFDGDVNDMGEVSVFYSAPGNDPTYPMEEFQKISFWGPTGDLYLVGDKFLPGDLQRDVVLRLHDDNANNVIEAALGEVTEVFDIGFSTFLRTANLFPAGSTGRLPAGLPAITQYKNSATCVTATGTTNTLTLGGISLGDRTPVLGQFLRLTNEGATPSSGSALWIGNETAPIPLSIFGLGPCSISSLPEVSIPFQTNFSGYWTWQFRVPFDAIFLGAEQSFEALTADFVSVPPRIDVSNLIVLRYGLYSYTRPQVGPQ